MTRDDIIRMALEAGWPASVLRPHGPGVDTSEYLLVPTLERFAALVAAAEREACLDWCRAYASDDGTAQKIEAAIRARGEKCQTN